MVVPRPLRLVLAACAAWLLVYELRVLFVPDLEIGPLFSRFAHDVVLLGAAAVCLARVPRVEGSERLAWALIGGGVLAWSLGEIYYTAVLWTNRSSGSPVDERWVSTRPRALSSCSTRCMTTA